MIEIDKYINIFNTEIGVSAMEFSDLKVFDCGNFMRALSAFQTEYPDVSMSLLTGTSSELLAKVMNHQLDGAFVTGKIESDKIVIEYMEQDELQLLTQKAGDAYPDLAKTRWALSPKGCPFKHTLEEWLRSEGISPAGSD